MTQIINDARSHEPEPEHEPETRCY